MSKIYVWCVPMNNERDVLGYAMAEDGICIASHLSSNEYFSEHDMSSTWKHEHYSKHYPDGWELIWLGLQGDDGLFRGVEADVVEGFKKAFELNQKMKNEEQT